MSTRVKRLASRPSWKRNGWLQKPNAGAWKKTSDAKLRSRPDCAPNRKPNCARRSRRNCAPKPLGAVALKKKRVVTLKKKLAVALKKRQGFSPRKKRAARPKPKHNVGRRKKLAARPKRLRKCKPKRTRAVALKKKRNYERAGKRVSAPRLRLANARILKRASGLRLKPRFRLKKTSCGRPKNPAAANMKESWQKKPRKPQTPITLSRSSDLKSRIRLRKLVTVLLPRLPKLTSGLNFRPAIEKRLCRSRHPS